METILAYTEERCRQCRIGKNLDQDETAKNARYLIGVLQKKVVAAKMKMSSQYLGDLLADPPRRPWNNEIALKFETAINDLRK